MMTRGSALFCTRKSHAKRSQAAFPPATPDRWSTMRSFGPLPSANTRSSDCLLSA